MPVPTVLTRAAVPLGGLAPAGAAPAPASAGGAVTPGADTLAFPIQTQINSNWCWAAVAASVSAFYLPGSTWTQCRVANDALPRTDCCDNPTPAACNVPWYLDTALRTTANLNDFRTGAFDLATVQTNITTDGRVVGVRIGWTGGGGHFVVVHGWEVTAAGDELVDVADPFYGASQIPHADLVSSYRSAGTWTHTYRTQP